MFLRAALPLVLLLAASEARAVTWRPPPPPSGPDLPKRYALDATVSTVTIAGLSFAGGARARVRDDPFQFELSYERDVTDHAQPDLRWLVLGGGGLARALNPRWDLFGSFLLGAYGVRIRDGWGTGWESDFGPAVGLRVGLWRHFRALRLSFVEPTVGLSASFVVAAYHHDATRDIAWGGPSGALTLSVGAQTVARGDGDD